MKNFYFRYFLLMALCIFTNPGFARIIQYKLDLESKTINKTGKAVESITVNNSIPGPTLEFTEGDYAVIKVNNKMDVDSSIHWHGLLVPPEMDGVPYVSFPPIKPHSFYLYHFPIRQAGTYWYHSHSGLQEQKGLYGAIVIHPKEKKIKADREEVVVLSDWSHESPHEILKTLRRGSEWYPIVKGSAQSFFGAMKAGMLRGYLKRELLRMPHMDLSDVAYDYFLANGSPETELEGKPGETVRLRIVDGSASTFFHLEYAGGLMTVVSADGQNVEPFKVKRLLIGVAETYDVLIKIPTSGKYELRATSHDASGYSSMWFGEGQKFYAPNMPKPNLYDSMGKLTFKRLFAPTFAGSMGMPDHRVKAGDFDKPSPLGHMAMDGMKMSGMKMDKKMKMSGSEMGHSPSKKTVETVSRTGKGYGNRHGWLTNDLSQFKNLVKDGMGDQRPWPPYDKLKALKPTSYEKDKPVKIIRLTLDGDMDRFVWFLNNKPISESDVIKVSSGSIARFVMINRTMMHHPMHLHGQFFRVINEHGEYSPLKHTVVVSPMNTVVFEFDPQEVGDWFFHCHLLYHMDSGMARVVHHEDYTPYPALKKVQYKRYEEDKFSWGHVELSSNMTEGYWKIADTRHTFKIDWEGGWRSTRNLKLETLTSYSKFVDRFFSFFGGMYTELHDRMIETQRGVVGISYILPFNIQSEIWADTEGGQRYKVEKHLALTPRLIGFGEVQYDTHEKWERRYGVKYILDKDVDLVINYHSTYDWGGGINYRF